MTQYCTLLKKMSKQFKVKHDFMLIIIDILGKDVLGHIHHDSKFYQH